MCWILDFRVWWVFTHMVSLIGPLECLFVIRSERGSLVIAAHCCSSGQKMFSLWRRLSGSPELSVGNWFIKYEMFAIRGWGLLFSEDILLWKPTEARKESSPSHEDLTNPSSLRTTTEIKEMDEFLKRCLQKYQWFSCTAKSVSVCVFVCVEWAYLPSPHSGNSCLIICTACGDIYSIHTCIYCTECRLYVHFSTLHLSSVKLAQL